jgi:hypothetical protein
VRLASKGFRGIHLDSGSRRCYLGRIGERGDIVDALFSIRASRNGASEKERLKENRNAVIQSEMINIMADVEGVQQLQMAITVVQCKMTLSFVIEGSYWHMSIFVCRGFHSRSCGS